LIQKVEQFQTPDDFWQGILLPDYNHFQENTGDLRSAFHSAISLFHMHDWIFEAYPDCVTANFAFTHSDGHSQNATDVGMFANALEQANSDFGLIRGIATAAKHWKVTRKKHQQNVPSHSSNVMSFDSHGVGSYNKIISSGDRKVMLEVEDGYIPLDEISKGVYEMWLKLKCKHGL
jgi:hypothetical protein